MHPTLVTAIRPPGVITQDELKEATRRREWALEYQPIVDLRSGRWVGAEALLRWRHPSRGWLLPHQFIDVVEASSEVYAVTAQVIASVGDALARLNHQGHDIYLSLNLVAGHFRRTATLHELLQAVQTAGVAPSRLMIELNERGQVDDSGGVVSALMATMRERQFQLAIDDFGTREASFEYLRRFPVSQLKIDKCLVDAIDVCPQARRLLQGVVELARCLDVSVIAEGVERPRQAITLRSVGVTHAQGFALGKPMGLELLEAYLSTQAASQRAA